jgi:adenosylmethionine-8-amino-7-oxononanoate aminotransferase
MTIESPVLMPALNKKYPVIKYGKGVYLYDTHGKKYLDACSGTAVVNIGHGVKEIAEIAYKQTQELSYVYRLHFTNDRVEELGSRLIEKNPSMEGVYFASSGSEAVEIALKLAVQHWKEQGITSKTKIITRTNSYHGATLGALGVTGHYERRNRYSSMLPKIESIDPPYCYRCPFSLSQDSCQARCADEFENRIKEIGPENIAAFIAEPIVGSAGAVLVPNDLYYKKIEKICKQNDILFIVDEVLTGIGRTGKWLALQHWDVEPDIVVLGKGLGAGYTPISAVLIKGKVIEPFKHGSGSSIVGHTHSSNPLSAAISLGVLDYLEKNKLIDKVIQKENLLKLHLEKLANSHSIIGDIRGKGFLFGIELVQDQSNKKPFPKHLNLANRIKDFALYNGLAIYPCSGLTEASLGDALMIAPPFTIKDEEIEEMMIKLDYVLEQVTKSIKKEVLM